MPAGTGQTTLSLTTDESATCRFGTSPGVAYASLPNLLAVTGGLTHSTLLSLVDGAAYAFYVRCQDGSANANPDDFAIAFSVASAPPPDSAPPEVTMTAPAGGATLAGTVTVTAAAADNVGVTGVQFLLNGAPLGAEDSERAVFHDVDDHWRRQRRPVHVVSAGPRRRR